MGTVIKWMECSLPNRDAVCATVCRRGAEELLKFFGAQMILLQASGAGYGILGVDACPAGFESSFDLSFLFFLFFFLLCFLFSLFEWGCFFILSWNYGLL